MRRYFKILILILIANYIYGQYTIPVEFADKKKKTTYIGTFHINKVLYASVHDFCEIFNINPIFNKETKKIEIKFENRKAKFSANNYFVIITDENGTIDVLQMANKAILTSYSLFIPVKNLVKIFSSLSMVKINYDSQNNRINIGTIITEEKFDITGILYEEKLNGTLVRFQANRKITDYDSWLRYEPDDKEKKYGWLYVTIANARVNVEKIRSVQPLGVIKNLMIFPSVNSVQFTFKLDGKISSTEIFQAKENNDLILTIHTPEKSLKPFEKNILREKERWKLDVVVIDPGHGGKDPGAIGVTGTKEKQITLDVALKLGKLIETRMPDVKVVYTRTKDEFVELYKRGQIANQANGKLFISLHCNSTPRKPSAAKGFEIYLLRPGKSEHAIKIAERENSVIQFETDYEKRYQELTEENFILVTMAQSAYMKYSEHFAEITAKMVSNHTKIEVNGVKQAGFYVLVGASMPNVLVEMGYLSNREDEKFLKSNSGQQQIAEALFKAIQKYKTEYDLSIEGNKTTGAQY